MQKNISKRPLLIVIGVILVAFIIWNFVSKKDNNSPLVQETAMLQKIELIGKIELTKFYISDVIEYNELQKIIFIPIESNYLMKITGEVVGGIDFTKIKKSDITISDDKIRVKIPPVEILSHKVDVQNAKVYIVDRGLANETEVIQKCYKLADNKILNTALKMGIYKATSENAKVMLEALFSNVSGKKVEITF